MKIIYLSDMTDSSKAYSYIPELMGESVAFYKLSDDVKLITSNIDAQILITDAMGRVGDDIISALPELKLIQSEGVGYQGVDMQSAAKHGVLVCNNKGINNTAVAEHTVMLILACLKELGQTRDADYHGKQLQAKQNAFGRIKELSECTVGLVGFGDIARHTARLLNAFGCKLLYYNRTRYEAEEHKYNIEYSSLDALLAQSDFVSLHLAVNSGTQGIVDGSFLTAMKKSAYLINTSRGELVDNEALYNAIKDGVIKGAGLDVIAPEPVHSDNILLKNDIKDKMIITPHTAGITSMTVKKMYRKIWGNIFNVLNGISPENIVSA